MKTDTVQVHRKSGKSPQSEQGKIHARECLKIPANGATLVFYSANDDVVLADVKVSANTLAALRQASTAAGKAFDEFLVNGMAKILDGLAPDQSSQAQPGIEPKIQTAALPAPEKEVHIGDSIRDQAERINQAVARSIVLSKLLNSHLDNQEHRSGCVLKPEEVDFFNFGFSLLSDDVNNTLLAASDAMIKAAYSKAMFALDNREVAA